jgi:hypothetical protein
MRADYRTIGLSEDGTVTKEPDLEAYPFGTNFTVTAVSEDGFEFVKWIYSEEEIATNPAIITIKSNATLTPVFGIYH